MDKTETKVEEAAERMMGKAVIEAMKRSSRAREIVGKLVGEDLDLGRYEDVQIDTVDLPEEIVVLINLPGADKERIDLRVTEDSVSVEAGFIPMRGKYIRRERPDVMKREIKLPAEIKPEGVTAKFESGVLEVHLPKLVAVVTQKVKIE